MSDTLNAVLKLLPDALILDVLLSPTSERLVNELTGSLTAAGYAPLDAHIISKRLLLAFCPNGEPTGLALSPGLGHPIHKRGTSRKIHERHLQPREKIEQPLLVFALRHIVQPPDYPPHPAYPLFLDLLAHVETALLDLLDDLGWGNILETAPMATENALWQLHYDTAGYPTYPYLARRLHAGLLSHLCSGTEDPTKLLTAPAALVPLLDIEDLLDPLDHVDVNPTSLRKMLWEAAIRWRGIRLSTCNRYVSGFLDLTTQSPPRSPGVSGFARRRRRPFTEIELDPELDPKAAPGHAGWIEECIQAARDADSPAEEDALSIIDELDQPYPVEMKDAEVTGSRRPPRFSSNQLALERRLDRGHPSVLTPRELAEFYRALEPDLGADSVTRFKRATYFLALDFAVHTGRRPNWLATVELGAPGDPWVASAPWYDPERGAILYPPRRRPGVPRRLLPPDPAAAAERREHDLAFEPLHAAHPIPLTPYQRWLVNGYCTLRARALKSPPSNGIDANSGPLLLVAEGGRLRRWSQDDSRRWRRKLDAAQQECRPGWPALRSARFTTSFTIHYQFHGLPPVMAFLISEHYRAVLEMPAIYSRVWLSDLAGRYAAAQDRLRAEILDEYKRLPDSTEVADPILNKTPTKSTTHDWGGHSAGSWHTPRLGPIQAVLFGLDRLAHNSGDPDLAHNARVVRLACLLTALTGIRPAEVCNLRQRSLDLDAGVIIVDGKDNYALTANRLIPLPTILRPALAAALAQVKAGPAPPDDRGRYLLWLERGGMPVRLKPGRADSILIEGGIEAKLSEVQSPDWPSLRHWYRSRALALDTSTQLMSLNYLMGHQPLGQSLRNRAIPGNLQAALVWGQVVADQLYQELGCPTLETT